MTTINVETSTTVHPKVTQREYIILALAGVVIVLLIASFAFAPASEDDVVPDTGAWLIGP